MNDEDIINNEVINNILSILLSIRVMSRTKNNNHKNNYYKNSNLENSYCTNTKLFNIVAASLQTLRRASALFSMLILALFSNSSQSIPFVFTKKKLDPIISSHSFTPELNTNTLDRNNKLDQARRKNYLDTETKRELMQIIKEAEEHYGLPKNLLYSVAQTESSFTPWVIRFNHKIHRFSTLTEAKSFLSQFEHNHHKHNIDIGFMQINNQHARFFKNLTSMLDPKENIWFAGKLLTYNITYAKSIKRAISIYNKGKYGALKSGSQCGYLQKVLSNWFSHLDSIAAHVIDIDQYIDKVKKCYKIGNHEIIYANHCALFFNNNDGHKNYSNTGKSNKFKSNMSKSTIAHHIHVNPSRSKQSTCMYSKCIYSKIIARYLAKNHHTENLSIRNHQIKNNHIKNYTIEKQSTEQYHQKHKNINSRQALPALPFV